MILQLGIVKLDGKLSKGLMLWWNTEEQYFQGVISENQAQFMNDINTIKERHTDEEVSHLYINLYNISLFRLNTHNYS